MLLQCDGSLGTTKGNAPSLMQRNTTLPRRSSSGTRSDFINVGFRNCHKFGNLSSRTLCLSLFALLFTLNAMTNPREVTVQALANRLAKCMVFNGHQQKYFLPKAAFARLITEKCIQKCLRGASSELIEFVRENATKIFAIVVYIGISGPELHITMRSFQEHGLNDEMLPVKNMRCNAEEKSDDEEESDDEKSSDDEEINVGVEKYKGEGEVTCSHHRALSVFHRLPWGGARFQHFYEAQWKFLSPVFTKDNFIYCLEPECVLPIKELEDEAGRGHFSRVNPAMLRADHWEVLPMVRPPAKTQIDPSLR